MPPKKKKPVVKACWDKVWVLGGEPCVCRLTLESILEDNNITQKRRFTKDDKIEDIKIKISNMSILQASLAIIIYDPNAEILKMCLELIEANKIAPRMLVIVTLGDTLDARSSFATKAQKNNRAFIMSYVEAGNTNGLMNYLSEWETGTGVGITFEAKKWMLLNAPIGVAKVKTATGKKDTEVYELEKIENDLNKLMALCRLENRAIDVKDFIDNCDYNQVADVWEFIKCSIGGNAQKSFDMVYKMIEQQGASSLLWLLNSQLAFLIQLKQLIKQGCISSSTLCEKMSYERYLGVYLDNNWGDMPECNKPNINIWRVKKAMESCANWKLETLVSQQQAVTNALLDLYSSAPEDIIVPFLILSLSGYTKYDQPLYSY